MNSNLFHNIANVMIALAGLVTAVMLFTGCTTLPTGELECSQSMISPAVTTVIMTGLSVLKIAVNILRDGVSGLTKPQPPVEK